MDKPTHKITLVHVTCREERECDVLSANSNWKLCLRLGFAGVYYFDLRSDRLLPTENSRKQLLWKAKNLEAVVGIWKHLTTKGVYIPAGLEKPLPSNISDRLAEIRMAETESLRNPSEGAKEWADTRVFNRTK